MNFLSSPGFSLACGIFNSVFAIQSFAAGNVTWTIIGVVFAAFCFSNYLNKR